MTSCLKNLLNINTLLNNKLRLAVSISSCKHAFFYHIKHENGTTCISRQRGFLSLMCVHLFKIPPNQNIVSNSDFILMFDHDCAERCAEFNSRRLFLHSSAEGRKFEVKTYRTLRMECSVKDCRTHLLSGGYIFKMSSICVFIHSEFFNDGEKVDVNLRISNY